MERPHVGSPGPMERRRPHRPAPPWSAGVLAGLRRTLRPLRSLVPPAPPAPTKPRQGPVRTPALQDWRALTRGAPAPWSAGVLAGLRRTLRPCAVSCRQRHRAHETAAGAGEDTGAPGLVRPDVGSAAPMERRRPRRPAPPWSAGVLAPACATRSVPRAVSCRQRRRTYETAAGAGEDTGAPGLARPDVGSPGPMERRRPRRPAPPWSAGVLAGLRHTLRPLRSLVPAAPPYLRNRGRGR